MNTYHKLIIAILMLCCTKVHAQSPCTPNQANIYTFTFGGHWYQIVKENLNWVNAAACAAARGGKLAEINSKSEQDTLFYYVGKAGVIATNTVAPDGGNASYLWLGGNDITSEGKWMWDGANTGNGVQFWQGKASGTAVGGLYNNWGNEPDDFNNQDALGFAFTNWPLGLAGQWNDVKETNLLYFIIEYDHAVGILKSEITNPKSAISIFPNPFNSTATIELNAELGIKHVELKLYNVLGQEVLQMPIISQSTQLDRGKLPYGMYFYTISNTTTIIGSGKVIIK